MTDAGPCRFSRDLLVARMRRLLVPMQPLPTGLAPRLGRLPDLAVVLFDVYGTMLISGSGEVGTAGACDSAQALLDALRSAHLEPTDPQAGPRGIALLEQAVLDEHQARRQQGIDWPEVDIRRLWARVVGRLRDEDLLRPPRACINYELLAVEYECRVNPVWPMPGLLETLRALKRQGLRLGIVSNSQFYTPLLFQALFDRPCDDLGFEPPLCSWSWQVGSAKPSEALFQPVLEHLKRHDGLPAHRILYVGNDIRNDIAPAADLGCRTALFAGDRRSLRLRDDQPDYRHVQPDRVLTALDQLPALNH